MPPTAEQKAVQEALQAAIENYVRVYEPNRPGLVVDWAIIAQATSFNAEEGIAKDAYHMAFSNGQMEDHRAVGLFRYAEHLLLHGNSEPGAEE